jgi:hypothetical protein
MRQYSNKKELEGKILRRNDEILFGQFKFKVLKNSLYTESHFRRFFSSIELYDHKSFFKDYFGYTMDMTYHRMEFNTHHYAPLTKAVIALYDIYEKYLEEHPEEKEKEPEEVQEEKKKEFGIMDMIHLNPEGFIISKFNPFVLGKFAPDPKITFNFCPILWLTVLAFLICIPVAILKGIGFLAEVIGKILFMTIMLPIESMYIDSLEELENRMASLDAKPWYVRWEKYWEDYDKWLEKESKRTGEDRESVLREIELEKEELKAKKEEEKRKRKEKSWKIPEIKITFGEKFYKKSCEALDKMKDRVSGQKVLIKATQRFFGIVFTGIMAAAAYFVLHLISRLIIWLADIWSWAVIYEILYILGAIILAVGTLALTIYGLVALFKYLYEKIPSNSLFAKAMRVLIVLPCYYFFNVFFCQIICVSLLWNILCKTVFKGIGLFIASGFAGAFDIVKMYFGKTKNATCPGVIWVNKKNEK